MGSSDAEILTQTDLYLDLMKRCLTDLIYINDPLANFRPYHPRRERPRWKELILATLERLLRPHYLRIVEAQSTRTPAETLKQRMLGDDWPARAHTMIGLKRLDNLQYCVEHVIWDAVPGDLIETGVWRGGACIFMRAVIKAYGETSRTVWVADSFAGLPPPDQENYPADAGDVHHSYDILAVSREIVEKNFASYGLLDGQVRFLEGWFKNTLPDAPIRQLAVIRLDCDMFESTWQALEALYDRLSPGGFVIVDDYQLPPCARAVQEFREQRGITDEIHDIDGCGIYWRRSA